MMKFFFALTLAFITFSLTKCAKEKGKSKEVTTTAAPSVEERESEDFNIMEVMVECNDSFRIETSYLEALNKSGSFPDETDKTPKCFIRCVLEKSAVASPASQFDVKRTAEIFPQIRELPNDAIIKMATDCTDRPETCKCERSYQYLKCLMEKVIDKYNTRPRHSNNG